MWHSLLQLLIIVLFTPCTVAQLLQSAQPEQHLWRRRVRLSAIFLSFALYESVWVLAALLPTTTPTTTRGTAVWQYRWKEHRICVHEPLYELNNIKYHTEHTESGSKVQHAVWCPTWTRWVRHQLLMAGHFASVSTLLSASPAVHLTFTSLFSASIWIWGELRRVHSKQISWTCSCSFGDSVPIKALKSNV